MKPTHLPRGYAAFLGELKQRVVAARTRAARAVNYDLVLLYWDIGQGIVEKQRLLGWGEGVVERLAGDLQRTFPEMTGFSARNLRDMKRMYLAYSSPEFWRQAVAILEPGGDKNLPAIWRQAVAKLPEGRSGNFPAAPVKIVSESGGGARQAPDIEKLAQAVREFAGTIPWGHHLTVLNKTTDPAARLYYLRATAQLGWSRSVLLNQIKAGAFERARREKKTHNFALALPEHFAEQADEMLKSRYNLEFLGLGRAMRERELEDRLVERLQQFILELGYGFCFVGRQHRLALRKKEYFVDLLFYHRFLKVLVAFDLKLGSFEPEHAGKMDFYLNLLNETERAPDDRPSIGIILCAEKDDIEVEFALKTKTNPIGVAEYELRGRLPAEFKGRLPTAKQLADAVREALP